MVVQDSKEWKNGSREAANEKLQTERCLGEAYRKRQSPKARSFVGTPGMYFELVGEISDIEAIAVGGKIDDIMRLRRQFGPGRWRKLKGIATVRTERGNVRRAELHWYEAHGIGRKKMKVKRFLD